MKVTTISLVIVFSLTFFCNIAKGNTTIRFTKSAEHEREHFRAVAEEFRYLEKYLKDGMKSLTKKVLPYVMEFSEKVKINISQECMKNGMALMMGAKNLKPWAFKFFDASGKVPDGMLIGSSSAVGHYDQCLDIEVKSTSKKDLGKKLFQGQYCMIEARALMYIKKPKAIHMLDFSPEMKKIMESDSIFAKFAKYIYFVHLGGIRIGICVPSGCSKEDLNSAFSSVLGNPNLAVSVINCEIKEKNTYSTPTILMLSYYAFIILLVLVASGIDFYVSHNNIAVNSKAIEALLAFSFVTNFRRFREPSQSTDNIGCLNGMKFFGMTWVLIGHIFMSGMGQFTHGILRYEHYAQEMPFQAILNAMFCVDTFFLIGAFLVTYLNTKTVILGKTKFNVLKFVIHRIWRVVPTYVIVLSTSLIIPLINAGPWYKEKTGVLVDACYDYWWRNLLFINNFFDATETCFLHTWYLTIDMQLYILSLIVLLPLIRWPKIGLSFLFLGVIGSIVYAFIITYVNEWPPVMLFSLMDLEETMEFARYVYFSPWTHFGPYGVGLLVGYIFAMNPNVKMSRLTQVLGWCIAFTCSFSILYGSRDWYIRPMPLYLAAVYAGLCRTVWSIGPAWIIYACSTGHGGIINWILSWRLFTHLGRLSFCAYIIHLTPLTVFIYGLKSRVQADLQIPVWLFLGLLSTTLALAFVLHLFVEIPFTNLERIFFYARKKETENTEKEKDTYDNHTYEKDTYEKDTYEKDTYEDGFKTEKNGGVIILMSSNKDSSTKL